MKFADFGPEKRKLSHSSLSRWVLCVAVKELNYPPNNEKITRILGEYRDLRILVTILGKSY